MPGTPFPLDIPDSVRPTPFRQGRVRFNVPDNRILQFPWGMSFSGAKMASPGGVAYSGLQQGLQTQAVLLPSQSWIVGSWEMLCDFEAVDISGIFGDGLPATVATGFQQFPITTKIPVGADGQAPHYNDDEANLGGSWWKKRRAKGAGWGAELPGVAAVPKPVLPTQHCKMRRVAETGTIFRPNQCVFLRFLGPAGRMQSQDALFTFYWGGPETTTWPTKDNALWGGEYCVSLFGSGLARLFERNNPDPANPKQLPDPGDSTKTQWRIVDTWQWEKPGNICGNHHLFIIVPESIDTLNFIGSGQTHLWTHKQPVGGYYWKVAATGAGPLRLDQREDARAPFQFGRVSFPTAFSGILRGPVFEMPVRPGAGTRINSDLFFLDGDTFGGLSTTAEVFLYDANTNEALPRGTDAAGTFFTTLHAGSRKYYPVYHLNASALGEYTPFLRNATFRGDIVVSASTPTSYVTPQINAQQVNGPDLEVDCDHALLTLDDYNNQIAEGVPVEGGLDNQADIRCILETTYDGLDPTKYMPVFDGILVQAAGLRWGRNLKTGPSQSLPLLSPHPKWKSWRGQLAGQWKRLADPWQLYWQAREWWHDEAATFDAQYGHKPPWLIVDIIDDLLKNAGYGDAQRHILGPPDASGLQAAHTGPRLFANGKRPDDYWIQPGASIASFIHHLCKDYLGARLVWDEAIPGGAWRLLYPPIFSGTYTPRWTFTTNGPPDNGLPRAVHTPASYPAETIYIRRYSRRLVKPEANVFVVTTADGADDRNTADIRNVKDGAHGETGGHGPIYTALGVNSRGADFSAWDYPAPDPNHIDFLTYGIRYSVYVNPLLVNSLNPAKTAEAVQFVCRRRMDAGAYGRVWWEFDAALVAYFDPDPVYAGGARKLRPFDVIAIEEDASLDVFMVTNVSGTNTPQDGGDIDQTATYQAVSIPTPLSY